MPLVDTNPKTAVGRSKPDVSLVPPVAVIHMADAFMDGAVKYGPYNWREKTVSLRTYIAAAMRHLQQFLDGETVASDSQVHHLGHVEACCAIMLDAISVGNAIDDRPLPGKAGEAIASIQKRREPVTKEQEEKDLDTYAEPAYPDPRSKLAATWPLSRGHGSTSNPDYPRLENASSETASTCGCY